MEHNYSIDNSPGKWSQPIAELRYNGLDDETRNEWRKKAARGPVYVGGLHVGASSKGLLLEMKICLGHRGDPFSLEIIKPMKCKAGEELGMGSNWGCLSVCVLH